MLAATPWAHSRETSPSDAKALKLGLYFEPGIPFLKINSKEIIKEVHKVSGIRKFITALSITMKIGNNLDFCNRGGWLI